MFFILTDQSVSGGPAVWAEIDQESFFNEYNIEGVSSDQNEIYLEFSPDKLNSLALELGFWAFGRYETWAQQLNILNKTTFSATIRRTTASILMVLASAEERPAPGGVHGHQHRRPGEVKTEL